MFYIFILPAILVLLTYIFYTCIFPSLISSLFSHYFKLEVTIGKLRLFAVHNVTFSLNNGITIELDLIKLSICFFSSKRKLLTLIIDDVRINVKKDENVSSSTKCKDQQDGRIESNSLADPIAPLSAVLRNDLLRSFLKHVGVEGKNIGIIVMKAFFNTDCLLNFNVQNVNLQLNERVGVDLSVNCGSWRLLRHERNNPNIAPCLLEILWNLKFGVSFDLSNACHPVEDAKIEVENPHVTLHEDFVQMMAKMAANKQKSKSKQTNNSFAKYLSLLPQKCELSVEGTKMKVVRFDCQNLIQLEVKSLKSICEIVFANKKEEIFTTLTFDWNNRETSLFCYGMKLMSIENISLQNKLTKGQQLNTNLNVRSLIVYYHQSAQDYLLQNFGILKSSTSSPPKNELTKMGVLSQISHSITVEISDVKLNAESIKEVCPISFHLEYIKCTTEFSVPIQDNFELEIVVDTMWLSQVENPSSYDSYNFKKIHRWNTPIVVSAILVKAKSGAERLAIQGLFDCVCIEWNQELGAAICHYLDGIADKVPDGQSSEDEKINDRKKIRKEVQFGATFSTIHLFYRLNTDLLCQTIAVESASVKHTRSLDRFDLVISGLSTSVVKTVRPYDCRKCRETADTDCVIPHFEIHKNDQEINVLVSDAVTLRWSTFTHMVVFTIAQEIENYASSKMALLLGRRPSRKFCEKDDIEKTSPSVKLDVKSRIEFVAKVSDVDVLAFEMIEGQLKVEAGCICLVAREFNINMNGHRIVCLEILDVKKLKAGHFMQTKRDFSDQLVSKENQSCIFNIQKVQVAFPHRFNFAQVVSEQAINVVKWLKLLHKIKSTTETSLRPDIFLNIEEINIEIKDNPFEVKLRDNYELLEDEQKECTKRKIILDEKIQVIRKSNLLLPAGKLEELYANLAKRNAEIYIKRRSLVDENRANNANLCLLLIKDFDMRIFADASMHGESNVTNILRQIDAESPYPDNRLEFATLWCRMIHLNCQSVQIKLRDFPQSLLEIDDFLIWGRLVGAEQQSSPRSKRTVSVDIEEPWCSATLQRGMQYLKLFHDFSCHIKTFDVAYGLCWEPVLSQLSQSLEMITKASEDPSPVLPFWDKMRLMYHGRLTVSVERLSLMLHASLDPYNRTEEMEIAWTPLNLDWTNVGKFLLKGDMDILIHTESKYDDCRLVHLPSLKLIFKLDWLCIGHPNDHHSIVPCAQDKVPEYSSNEKHDSFRAFRSEKLDLSVTLETKEASTQDFPDRAPTVLFYANTMKWFESLKMILSGVTRPTRRGVLFGNAKPRKLQLSRHYGNVRLGVCIHRISIHYWMSFAQERGFELHNGRLSLSSEQSLSLLRTEDGLIHRSSAVWSVGYMNCEVNDAEIWLISSSKKETQDQISPINVIYDRSFFLNVCRVSYGREASFDQDLLTGRAQNGEETPTHRLVVHNLRGSWTVGNRDLILAIIDAYQQSQLLKRNLSTDALKSVKVESHSVTPSKVRSLSTISGGSGGTPSLGAAASAAATPSPMSRLQSSHAANMLHKLISETDSNVTVYTEELTDMTKEPQLYGIAACQTDDVLHKNWLIELVNSQVMLKGAETSGYMIVSAAKTQILQRVHRPIWRSTTLCSKTTWVGSLDCMQYYATVGADDFDPSGDNINWLTLDNIEEKDSLIIADLPDMVGSGQSVGGVVSDTVGVTSPADCGAGADAVQLQRIVSRCGCHFFFASYGEDVDPEGLQEGVPLPPEGGDLWDEVAVDSLTIVHNELNCSSNSRQYLMILDIINNLLLYTEPKKKESNERLQRKRFQLQLSSIEDQRKPILQLQNNVRLLVQRLKHLQREIYSISKMLDGEDASNDLSELLLRYDRAENDVEECKEQISVEGDELAVIISCFKETQLTAKQTLLRCSSSKDQQRWLELPSRRNEVCFKHAKWRLTEEDGQLGIADIVLANFLYSKITKNDDSIEHLQELGYVKIENCLPNQLYKIALQPTELKGNVPVDRQRVLRVYCREKPPVGGISIKEHFEINVTPFTIGVTHGFFKSMLKFFFPDRVSEKTEGATDEDSKHKKKRIAQIQDAFLRRKSDDIEKMKERAEQNKLFLFIKIPEVPIRVSYKGEKEKNIEDINDFSLLLPTLEYHNVTWTWLDFLMNIKNDSKKYLLSQAIKQKLQIKSSNRGNEDVVIPQEEDKARMLLGSKLFGGVDKKAKKGLFGRNNK